MEDSRNTPSVVPILNSENSPSIKPDKGKWRGVMSTVVFIALAPIIAILLTSFVFQSYEVQGRSMETTLSDKDRLIIWKLPRTVAKITHHAYVPHRDDVIVFTKEGLYENPGGQQKQLIKRVIGLPGDRVVVHGGYITIYNIQNPGGYNPDSGHDFTSNIGSPTTGNVDLTVPDGEVFVSGDNRTDSYDSRDFGPIPSRDIIGKLVLRILPANKLKGF